MEIIVDKALIDGIMSLVITVIYGILAGFACSVIHIIVGFGASLFMGIFLVLCFSLIKCYYCRKD
jgi:uncharacterized membrane protein YqgA involved in biofilm formation